MKFLFCLKGAAAGLSYIGAIIFMTYERYGDIFSYVQSVLPAFVILGMYALRLSWPLANVYFRAALLIGNCDQFLIEENENLSYFCLEFWLKF